MIETVDGWLIGDLGAGDASVEIELVTPKAREFVKTFLTQNERVYIHRNYDSIEINGHDALRVVRDMLAGGLRIR